MNRKYYEKSLQLAFGLLEEMDISNKEKGFRRNRLENEYKKLINNNPDNTYYSLAHEILCMSFLKKRFSDVAVSEDHKSCKGSDFTVLGHSIEAVCPMRGSRKKMMDFLETSQEMYSTEQISKLVNERYINAIVSKVCKFGLEVKSGDTPNQPFILFLSAGDMFSLNNSEPNGSNLLEVLYGRFKPQIVIDKESGHIVDDVYSTRVAIMKHENASIPCNIFLYARFELLSGILFTEGPITMPYDQSNVYLFINPIAKNPIKESFCSGLSTWKLSECEVSFQPAEA